MGEYEHYREILEKAKDVRDYQILSINKKIKELRNDMQKWMDKDLVKAMYINLNIAEKGISLDEFRRRIYGTPKEGIK